MKIINSFIIITALLCGGGLQRIVMALPANGVADSGTIESFQVNLKLELKKPTDEYVTVLEPGIFLEVFKSGAQTATIEGQLKEALPPTGTYKAIRYTLYAQRIKANFSYGGTFYYTKSGVTVSQGGVISTLDSGQYGQATLDYSASPMSVETLFPNPLFINSGEDARIAFVNRIDDTVIEFEANNGTDEVIFVAPVMLIRTFVTDMPAEYVVLTINGLDDLSSPVSVQISIMYNAQGHLIGAHCYEPSAGFLLNCSDMKQGAVNGVQLTGKIASFDLSFWEGGVGGYYKQFLGSYDCNSNIITLDSIERFDSSDISQGINNAALENVGYSLNPPYSIECTTLNLNGS